MTLRIIPEIDKNPRIVSFAQTTSGKILLIACFGILLLTATHSAHANPLWLALMAGIALCTFLKSRALALCLSVIVAFVLMPFQAHVNLLEIVISREGLQEQQGYFVGLRYAVFAVTLALMAILVWKKSRLRRPVLSLLIAYFTLIALAESHFLHGAFQVALWTFLAMWGPYFWFLAYAVGSQDAGKTTPLLQLGLFYPFWNFSAPGTLPYSHDINHLERVGRDSKRDFAVTQLKGIKLIAWCIVLQFVNSYGVHGASDYFHIPLFKETLASQAAGQPYPSYLCWASLICRFCLLLLYQAIVFGITIATARMAGFRLMRNCYKPLSANSIAEFWRRVSYYFYQVMMTFFFYPTFFTCFKKYKRLRLFFATFMAAGVGNILFHFMGNIYFIADLGLGTALFRFQNYIFYGFALATGIGISQLMPDAGRPPNGVVVIAAARIRICLFFCLLSVFDDLDGAYSLVPRFQFILHLFGV